MDEVTDNIKLNELADIESLSVRAFNICLDTGLHDLEKILQFFSKHKTFKKIRNCGDKTNRELIEICKKYMFLMKNGEIPNKNNKFVEIIENLTLKQQAIVKSYIAVSTESLSTENKYYFNGKTSLDNLKDLYYEYVFDNLLTNTIDKTILKERNLFLQKIKDFIMKTSVNDEQELMSELLQEFLYRLFSIHKVSIRNFIKKIDFSNGIPLFQTIHLLIENQCIFNRKEWFVFKQVLGFYGDKKPLTLSEAGKRIGVSRQRIHQIRNYLLENFNNYFSFVRIFEKETVNLYNIEIKSSTVKISNTFIDTMNKNEMVNFNIFFVHRIILILFGEKYTLEGKETMV